MDGRTSGLGMCDVYVGFVCDVLELDRLVVLGTRSRKRAGLFQDSLLRHNHFVTSSWLSNMLYKNRYTVRLMLN